MISNDPVDGVGCGSGEGGSFVVGVARGVVEACCVGDCSTVGKFNDGVIVGAAGFRIHETVKILIAKTIKPRAFMEIKLSVIESGYCSLLAIDCKHCAKSRG